MSPEFRKPPAKPKPGAAGAKQKVEAMVVTEPRCHVCKSKFRQAIERELIYGTSYQQIADIYGIDRRGVSNHNDKHLRIEDAAMRALVKREAEARQENIEEGLSGAIKRRQYLESALRKAQEALINNEVIVEPKDAVSIIERLEKLDEQTSSAAIDEMRTQFFAFLQAVKEQVPRETWEKINFRTKELVNAAGRSSHALDEGRAIETEIPSS